MITDSNRRRVLVPSRLAQNAGPVLAADEEPSVDAAVLDPFARGSDAQTVAVYDGDRGRDARRRRPATRSSRSTGRSPRSTATRPPHWQADRALTPDRHVLTVAFDAPRDVAYVDLLPYDDRRVKVTAVEIAGRTYRSATGWNRLPVGLRGVASLAVRISRRAGAGPDDHGRHPRAADPRRAGDARRCGRRCSPSARCGGDRAAALTYVFQRTTGDDPFRRDPWHGASSSVLVRDRGDAERGLERVVLAAGRAHVGASTGGSTAAADAPDAALDALVGAPAARFNSSARFQGRPGFRASSAFDGTPQAVDRLLAGRAARVDRVGGRGATLRELTLDAGPGRPPADAGPAAQRERRLAAGRRGPGRRGARSRRRSADAGSGSRSCARRSPPGTPGIERQRRAVGIAEIRGRGRAERRACRARARCGARLRRVTSTVGPRTRRARASRARSRTSTPGARCARAAASRRAAGRARRGCRRARDASRRTCCACARATSARGRRRRAASSRPGTATRGGREGVQLALDRPGPPDPGRELQPRAPRDLRRPGPRRARGGRRLRHRLARPRRRAGT